MNSTLATLMVAMDAKEQGDLATYNTLIDELCDVSHVEFRARRTIERERLVYEYEDILDDEDRRQWRIEQARQIRETKWLHWKPLESRLSDFVNLELTVGHTPERQAFADSWFRTMMSYDKIPYTDAGIDMVRKAITEAMMQVPGVTSVEIPEPSPEDRRNMILRPRFTVQQDGQIDTIEIDTSVDV